MKKRHYLSILCLSGLLMACSSSKKERAINYDTTESYDAVEVVEPSPVSTSEEMGCIDLKGYNSAPITRDRKESTDYESEYDYSIEENAVISDDYRHSDSRKGKRQQQKANLLTATEINDFKKWDEWLELLNQDFEPYKNLWGITPRIRFVARAIDNNQRPIVDAEVTLYNPSGQIEWIARTDNTGTAQLWENSISNPNSQNQQPRRKTGSYKLSFSYGNETRTIENAQPYPQETNVIKMRQASRPSNNVDIFFIIDATGSMSDELSYLQNELYSIINKIQQDQSNLNIRMGSLVYRDKGDEYVVRKSRLNANINATVNFLKQQYADGGGDTPEAVDAALYQAVENENWNPEALARIAFLVLDAPPHDDSQSIKRVQDQIKLAAKKGIRLIPLVASGMEQDGEYLMRSMALATNGTYAALTDDSGIGNPHAKPTTDYYRVEKLNTLLIRLINEYTRIPKVYGQ